MYEKKSQKPIARRAFAARLVRHLAAAGILVSGSLAVGVLGYMLFEGLPLVDAFLNAALLLGGLGPMTTLGQASGKVFTGLYALFGALVFVVSTALVVTPVAHRLLHKFHWDERR